jgi:serine/threonine-protein kinase
MRPGPSPSGEPAADSPWNQVLQQLRAATAGEFVIQRELGRGGFAAVFLAHEIVLGRQVAIKVMSPAVMMGEGMVERFLQEARTVASLNHPHIITIHSVRRLEELPYFVMKFVRGRSLEHVLRREGRLPVPVIRDLLFQVGSALAYAHRRGVIHRDIKPANILLDDEGNAIVTDFGIAKVAESPKLTATGMVIGTLTYMSPEQIDTQGVGWASDQYSLGIVAYEMLTGTVPFTGSSFAIMHAHAQTPPSPIRNSRPDCPPDMEAAVLRMLAKDPAERWPTMGEALAALGAVPVPDTDPLRQELARLVRADLTQEDDGPSTVPSPVPQVRAEPAQAAVGGFSLAVSAPAESLPVGGKVQLKAVLRDATSREVQRQIEWRSSDAAVATVTAAGVVSAIGQGESVITARADGAEASVRLLVGAGAQRPKRRWWVEAIAAAGAIAVAAAIALGTRRNSTPIDSTAQVAAVELSTTRSTVSVGDSAMLVATVRSDRGLPILGKDVSWTSSDPARVSVDSTGMIVARAPGTATVTATSDRATATAAITVTAKAQAVASATVLPRDTSVPAGASFGLRAITRSASGDTLLGHSLHWTSSDPRVARVDPTSGQVTTGQRPGQVELAVLVDENVRGVARLTVLPPPTATAAVTPPVAPPEPTRPTPPARDSQPVQAKVPDVTKTDTVAEPAATPDSAEVKPPVPTDGRIQDLAAGGSLTCGTLTGGQTICWGGGEPGPTTIAGFGFAQVAAGEAHACGLTRAGEAYCWGSNSQGQLGDGSTKDHPTPVPVKLAQRFSSLSAGASHTCGITLTGAAYCWGNNSSGQLGDGSETTRTQPSLVHGSLELKGIAAGGFHTCAVTSDGRVFCWGDGSSGQLGNKSQEKSLEPFPLEASASFRAITAGHRHTCALTDAGKAYCWGQNTKGQIGDGSTDDRPWPQPVVLIESFRAIDAGTAHTCGILAKGGLFCWGDNSSGQLGDGTRSMRLRPTAVVNGQRFVAVEAGATHTCGTAENGRVLLCWGSSSRGQAGAAGGTQTTPTEVHTAP